MWDDPPDNNETKIRFKADFDSKVDRGKLERCMRCPDSSAALAPAADEECTVNPQSCWGLGSSKLPLAASALDDFRNRFTHRGVRKVYEAVREKSLLSSTLLAKGAERPVVDMDLAPRKGSMSMP